MGWHSGWRTKEELVEHLVSAPGSVVTVLDHSLVGRNLWTVCRLDQDYAGRPKGLVFLHLDRMSPPTKGLDDMSWGYQGTSEWDTPSERDCPERLLAQSQVTTPAAVDWRAACRAWLTNESQRRRAIASLKPGDPFMCNGHKVEFTRAPAGRRVRYIAGIGPDGREYRWPAKDVQPLSRVA